MNRKQVSLSGVLAVFLAASAYVVYACGLKGVLTLMTDNGVALLLSADLMIALTLVSIWIWNDARDRGLSPMPYMVLTLLTGSAGPLLYLIRRESALPFGRTTVAAPVR
jgi:hypothetical protein